MKNILFIFYIIFFISCGDYVEFKESPLPFLQGRFPLEELTFENINNKVLKNNCLSCHGEYEDFEIVKSKSNEIIEAMTSGRMPKNAPALSRELQGLFKAWVEKGAPFGDNPPPSGGSNELSAEWRSISKKVIFPKCLRCHNPNGQASFLDLSTRQKFFEQRDYLLNGFSDVENSYLFEVLNDDEEPMPPASSGIERLTTFEKEILKEWIEKGLP
ncbi:hypothetical protein A9Q84_02955 [Halobacteriovorax marinus]|uniref:Cytochrome C Planctomycete-type domain-containing protein n=1 Tax=Halobacteriovorax marinus TaxID=97084 RepID=A0A1Y5FD57_9BACT|nr:hypothetical protein A9Q84_02955 [Halobacteriovorax marinus]